jgi:alginate O-acetyltransferase complex protein AlgJ
MTETSGDARLNANEERSQHELATTEVSPRVARVMSLAFVALVAAVPLTQAASELRTQGWVQALDVFTRVPSQTSLHAYEEALENRSDLKGVVQPRLQEALTAVAGVGNDRAVPGAAGWLFYQPGIDYVAGPGFLDPGLLRLRANRMLDREHVADAQLDPRLALRALHQDLTSAGIRLVLVPVPDKAALEGRRLSPAFVRAGAEAVNPDWSRFVAGLREAGLEVFDVPRPSDAGPSFLEQDTHWTPRYMQDRWPAVAGIAVDSDLANRAGHGTPRRRSRGHAAPAAGPATVCAAVRTDRARGHADRRALGAARRCRRTAARRQFHQRLLGPGDGLG